MNKLPDIDEYRTITAQIDPASSTDRALAVSPPAHMKRGPSHVQWIPKSLIHGGDLLKIEHQLFGTTAGFEATFRVLEWKAEELGWS